MDETGLMVMLDGPSEGGNTDILYNIYSYYMASSASGQDELNRALWLATRAGKMEPSCPLRTTRCIPQIKFTKSHIINPLLTKFVRSRWLDIGLVFFCEFINTQKKNLANIQPSLPRTWSITHTQRPAFNTMSMRLLRRYVGARVLITLGRCGDQHGFREKIECMSTEKPSYAGNLVTWQLSDHVMIWWKFISITARIVYLLQPCGTLTSPMATSFTWFSLINSSTPSRSCDIIRARESRRFDDNYYLITLSQAEKLMSVTILMIPEARCFITPGTYFQRFHLKPATGENRCLPCQNLPLTADYFLCIFTQSIKKIHQFTVVS